MTFDARNHGQSEHTETMNYPQMSEDMRSLIQNEEKCTLIGHSMGGRTAMYLALTNPSLGNLYCTLFFFLCYRLIIIKYDNYETVVIFFYILT